MTQKVRPPHWPPDQSLWGSRAENKMQAATPCSVLERQWPVLEMGNSQTTSLRDWGEGVRRCGESVVPTPPHLGQWTKGPPARPEAVAGEWRQTVAKRPPVISRPPRFDPDWGGQQGGLREQLPLPPPLTTTNPPGQKVFLLHVPWARNSAFSLICFAQLNFRGHPATSLWKGHDPGGRG